MEGAISTFFDCTLKKQMTKENIDPSPPNKLGARARRRG
jgi:hypothetical protein